MLVTSKRMYAILSVVAVSAGVVVSLATTGPDEALLGRRLGEMIGRILAIFVIASLLPTIWLLIRREHKKDARWPTLLGIAVAILFGFLSMEGAFLEQKLKTNLTVFSPLGCSHQVTFPGTPELKNLTAQGATFIQANLYTSDSFIRAECIPNTDKKPKTNAEIINKVDFYIKQNGLTKTETSIEVRPDGIYAFVRGHKLISDRWSTFKIIVVTNNQSVMSIVAGGVSEKYPTKIVSEFLETLKLRS